MKKYNTILIIFLMIITTTISASQTNTDQQLLEKAKVDLFDRKWEPAIQKIDQLLKEFPDSKYYDMALFYKGKCLEEMRKNREAVTVYTRFLDKTSNGSLREEATIALIDLHYLLYQDGNKDSLKKITGFLKTNDRTISYYAAFKLSYAKDLLATNAAVPVLKKIISTEPDNELVDRAKLALMRINPKLLKETKSKSSIENQMLHIHIYDKIKKNDAVSISIPFSLARLAFESLPEKEKNDMEKKGYNFERLIKTLSISSEILRFETEDTTFKIWVD